MVQARGQDTTAGLAARVPRSRPPLFAWLMVLPAIVVLLAVTIYPLIYSLRESFYRLELSFSPAAHWVGLQNYVDAFTKDPRFWPAMGRSFYLVGFGVLIELVLGFGLALVLNRLGRARTIVTALLLVPVMIAPVAVSTDGATRWRLFTTMTLPLLQPLIIVTVLIRAMDIFKTFDTIYVMTGGGPGSSTETASFYTYLQGLQFFSFGYAAAISYIQLIVITVVATLLVRRMRKGLG